MAIAEVFIIVFIFEQNKIRLARFSFGGVFRFFYWFFQLGNRNVFGVFRKCRARRYKKIAVIGIYNLFRRKFQRFDESFFEFRQKVQRSAQKCNYAVNRSALRQISNRLIYNRLKNWKCNISFFCAVIHQGLNVSFCENAATWSDCVNLLAFFCKCI